MRKIEEVLNIFIRQGFISPEEKFIKCHWDYSVYIGDKATIISLLSGKILSQLVQRTGYVNVWFGGKGYSVHRLVAMHHIPNLYGKAEVNHIDCNKENNIADNLVWMNKRENTDHAMANDRYKGQRTPPGKMWRLINGKRQLIDEPQEV